MDSPKQKTPELQTQEPNEFFTVRPRPGKERWAYLTLEESRKRNKHLKEKSANAETSTHGKER